MMNSSLSDLLAVRFDTQKHGWKSIACKAIGISRPTLDRYLSLDSGGDRSRIPESFLMDLLNCPLIGNESTELQSAYDMVNLFASGLCVLQEGIDRVGHIQAPYPPDLICWTILTTRKYAKWCNAH
jgi:hypothetical protein